MICSDKEWKSCREERLGCEGCYYDDTEERMKDILQSFVDLAEESSIAKDLEDDIKATKWALSKIKELEKERDYYKARYLEFNEGMIAGMKAIEKNDKKCLHCGSNETNYCENCFQDLIGQNAKLQIEQHIPRID